MGLPYSYYRATGFENVVYPPEFGFSLLTSELVLVAMGFFSLGFYLSLRLKALAIRKLGNLSVNVFDKTFNIFDPFPDRTRIIQSSVVAALPFFTLFAAIILSFVVMAKIIEAGLLLASLIFVICAALMMLEGVFEIYSNANVFAGAVKKGAGLGEGDLTVLSIVRETLPKLKMYYLALAIVFFASSVMLPYVLPGVVFVFVTFVTAPIELVSSQGVLAIYYPVLLLVVAIVTFQFTADKIRSKILGLPLPQSLIALTEPFEFMRQWVCHPHELAHRRHPEPEEMHDGERRKD